MTQHSEHMHVAENRNASQNNTFLIIIIIFFCLKVCRIFVPPLGIKPESWQ